MEPQLIIQFPKYFGLKISKTQCRINFGPLKVVLYTPLRTTLHPWAGGGPLFYPTFKHAGREELPANAGTPEPRDEADQETDLKNLWERGNKIHAYCNFLPACIYTCMKLPTMLIY